MKYNKYEWYLSLHSIFITQPKIVVFGLFWNVQHVSCHRIEIIYENGPFETPPKHPSQTIIMSLQNGYENDVSWIIK